jgi:hypothetical protein
MEYSEEQRSELLKEIVFKLIETNPDKDPQSIMVNANVYLDYLVLAHNIDSVQDWYHAPDGKWLHLPEDEKIEIILKGTLGQLYRYHRSIKDSGFFIRSVNGNLNTYSQHIRQLAGEIDQIHQSMESYLKRKNGFEPS